jgi:hypothetical protein
MCKVNDNVCNFHIFLSAELRPQLLGQAPKKITIIVFQYLIQNLIFLIIPNSYLNEIPFDTFDLNFLCLAQKSIKKTIQ